MIIQNIKIQNIRSYEFAELPINKGINAIYGNNGSGKTSLVDLISRIYDPQKGDILIGNKNLKSIEISELRSLISYVPQDNFLFSESIQKNIEFGNPNSSMDEIIDAAKLAQIDLEIRKFENEFLLK